MNLPKAFVPDAKAVLVIGARQRSALAVIRSLGSKGIHVIAADDTPVSIGSLSKYTRHYLAHPTLDNDVSLFQHWLLTTVTTNSIDFVIPITEKAIIAANQIRSEVQARSALLTPPSSVIDEIADKVNLVILARKLCIPTPESQVHANSSSFRAEEYDYPLVIKPARSVTWSGTGWIHGPVRIAYSPKHAHDIMAHDPALYAQPFLTQEYIDGSGAAIFSLYCRGRPIVWFAHKRVREKPPQGGVSVLSEAIEIDPNLQLYADAILTHAAWDGVAMIEFRIHKLSGTPYLMEVNPRFWGSLQLAIDSGIDFPGLLIESASGSIEKTCLNYKVGTQLRWLLGDLDSLLIYIRDPGNSVVDKVVRTAKFLFHPIWKSHGDVLRVNDPRPGLYELAEYVRGLHRRMFFRN